MSQRRFNALLLALATATTHLMSADTAPAFKFIKSFSAFDGEKFPQRVERRLIGGSSPIHFINPFMNPHSQGLNPFNFFGSPAMPMGSPSSSAVYKLPLKMFSNGKPHAVFHGLPKPQAVMEYLPQAMSNIIRLPLKYISNARPIGVYFKDPSFNYL